MMRFVLWNWVTLFVFAVAALVFVAEVYTEIGMNSFWMFFVGTAFMSSSFVLGRKFFILGVWFILIAIIGNFILPHPFNYRVVTAVFGGGALLITAIMVGRPQKGQGIDEQ